MAGPFVVRVGQQPLPGNGAVDLGAYTSGFVPYTGATQNLGMGAYAITAAGFTGPLTGNVTGNVSGSAGTLSPGRTINGTLFDGSAAITITAAPSGAAGGVLTGSYPNPGLAATTVTPASYGSASQTIALTVGADGRLTAAAAGDISITAAQLNNVTISAGATLSGSSSGTNTGDITFSGQNYLSLTGQALTASAVDLSGTNATGTLAAGRFPALTGDGTTVAGALAFTLATVNSNVGTFGDATHSVQTTVNGKGIITAISSVAITGTPPGGSAGGDLSGTYPNPTVAKINGATLGTVTATSANFFVADGSAWQSVAPSGDVTFSSSGVFAIGAGKVTNTMLAGSIDLTTKVTGVLPYANGGTGANSFTQHGVVTAGASALGTVAPGSSGNVLTSNGTDWVSQAAGAGSGTVTSVTFTGDGTVLSSTPSSAVTTSGTVAATLNTQSANLLLAGPTSGPAAAPTFRAMVTADIPSNIVTLAKLATQSANTFLANNTAGGAVPAAIGLSASQLAGRGSSGNVTAIALGSSMAMLVGATTLDNVIVRNAVSTGAGYTVTTTDNGKLVSFGDSTDRTFAFTAVATLGSGWYCYISNDGTSNATILLDPNGSETIDGRTTYKMYPGELRLVQCNGANLITRVLKPFNFTTTATITFIPPPGYTNFRCLLQAGGGSGGTRLTTGNASGGGGGALLDVTIPASNLAATGETLTIAATVSGVSGNSNGNNGNNTSITASNNPLGSETYTATGGGGGISSAASSAANSGKGGFPSSPVDYSNGPTSLLPIYGWTSAAMLGTTGIGLYSSPGCHVTSGNTPVIGGNCLYGGAGGGSWNSTNGGVAGGAAFQLGTQGSSGGITSNGGIGCGSGGNGNGASSGSGGAGQAQLVGVP